MCGSPAGRRYCNMLPGKESSCGCAGSECMFAALQAFVRSRVGSRRSSQALFYFPIAGYVFTEVASIGVGPHDPDARIHDLHRWRLPDTTTPTTQAATSTTSRQPCATPATAANRITHHLGWGSYHGHCNNDVYSGGGQGWRISQHRDYGRSERIPVHGRANHVCA